MSAPFQDSGWAEDRVDEALQEVAAAADQLRQTSATEVVRAAELVYAAIGSGNRILVCGNGGSAAESQHFAGELLGRFLTERQPLPAVALTVDTSVLTAIGNDYGFENVFARQIEGIGQPGDVLLAISTSGRSPNILAALNAARERGLTTIALVGTESNADLESCDLVITIPEARMPRVQEMHLVILHTICDLVDLALEADS